jgi:hypothetical protein
MKTKGGGMKKGGEFERVASRLFTYHITGKHSPEIFWRAEGSGGKATKDRAAGKETNQSGDLRSKDPLGQAFLNIWSVELKHRADIHLDSFITGKGELVKAWKQCLRDASAANRRPLLVFKMGMPYVIFRKWAGLEFQDWMFNSRAMHIKGQLASEDIFYQTVMCSLEDFFCIIKAQRFDVDFGLPSPESKKSPMPFQEPEGSPLMDTSATKVGAEAAPPMKPLVKLRR